MNTKPHPAGGRRHSSIHVRPARGGRLIILAHALLTACGLALPLTTPSNVEAQALMVGADGAIHLDESLEQGANHPVIIQQTPELIAPGITGAPIPLHQQLDAQPLAHSLAAPYDACPPFVPYMPVVAHAVQRQPMPIKFAFFGEFLFLHPTGVDMIHAQQQDGTGGAGTVPFGELVANDFHYEPGVRIGGDMAVGPASSIAASYTWFESNAQTTTSPPAGATTPAVGSLVHVPGAAVQGTPGALESRSVLDFQLANAEYRTRLHQGPRHWINGGLGLQYAHLEQEFGQTGPFLFPAGTLVTQSNVEFDGGGPRLSLDGGRNIGNRGFSLYARSSLSPMAGQFHSDYSLRNETTAEQLALARWKDDRIMTVLDYEAGLAWTGPRKRWRFSAGYLQSHWFNAVTPNAFIPAVQSSDYHDVSDTISFDGLTARVEHLW